MNKAGRMISGFIVWSVPQIVLEVDRQIQILPGMVSARAIILFSFGLSLIILAGNCFMMG